MSEAVNSKKSGGLFYGWVNVAIAFLVMFFTVGVIVTAYSATSMYVISEWGITNTQNSTLINIRTITAIISMALCAHYYRKFSAKTGLFIGVILGALAYVVLALANGMSLGVPGMALAGLSHGFAGMYGLTIVVNNWFVKKKSTVLGVLTTASGFTTMLMPKLIVKVVENVSLQASFWMVAAMFAVVAVIVLLFLKEAPAEGGRYGEGEEIEETSKRTVTEKYKAGNAECIFMLIACFTIGAICYAQGQFRTLAYTSVGYEPSVAAQFLSSYGLWIIIGKLIFGWVNDRISMRKMTIVWFLLVAVSHFLLASTGAEWFKANAGFWAYIANVLYSLGGPICTVGLSLYGIELAKDNKTKEWIRNYLVVYNIGGLVFVQLGGIIADATGSYSAVFKLLAVIGIIGAVLSFISYNGAFKKAKKENAELTAE